MASTIRDKAEEVMQERYVASELRQDADLEAILHELRVHQIELELQNDELRRTQVELEALQRKYFDLYRLAPVAYLHLDEQGIIQDLNLKGAELLGHELQAIVAKPLITYLESSVYGEFFHHLQNVFASPDRQTCEIMLRGRGGATRNVLLESIAAWEAGKRICRTVVIDVTARHQAERELQQSEARLRALFEASPVPLATISRIDGTVRYANPALSQMLAASLPAMIGRMAPLPKDLLQFLLAGPWDQVSMGREWRIVRNNGEHIWVVVTCQSIVLGTEPCMMAGFHDVTERRIMEETLRQHSEELRAANAALVEAARLKDQFLANMSHELRTPLTGILGMAEALGLAVYGVLNERQLRAVDTIEESGRHLLDLITDILDLSKVEAGKLDLVAETIQLDVLCSGSIRMIEQMAQAKHQKVTLTNNCSDVEFLGDERRLRQVLVNLLSNAVKFTHDGGEIGLTVECDSRQCVLIFTVWDTGIGIHPDNIHKLFQPFVQIDTGLARQYAGTGLGLALVRRFTELHGGSVIVDSNPGAGSRFTVRIPLITPSAPSSAVRNTSSNQHDTPRRVVLLEDSAITAEHLANYLRILGIPEVIVHRRVRGAVDLIAVQKPDAVLLDLFLPDGSGWEILSQLKSNQATANIPVVVVTVTDDRSRADVMGATAFLRKPVSLTDLQQALDQITASAPPVEAPVLQQTGAVLLVDDSEITLRFISDLLTSQGYAVVTASNAQEALSILDTLHPVLILMDIQMPGMDGLEAIGHIRQRPDPAVSTTRIIALTALALAGDRERCLAAGADVYLAKPIGVTELLREVRSAASKAAN